MILRRVSKYIVNKSWIEVGIELALIILGVFLGLQVNNWNAERIAQLETKSYYARLVEDLKSEKESRISRITYYTQTYQHGESALFALEQSEKALDKKFIIDIYQTTQIWNYNPHTTTYDELLSANIANIIPDANLRSRLANYYFALSASKTTQQESVPFRDKIRYQMLYASQKLIREHCGDKYEFLKNNMQILTLPEKCNLTMEPLLVAKTIKKLRAYGELQNGLNHHLNIIESKLFSLKAHIPPTDLLIKYIEEINHE